MSTYNAGLVFPGTVTGIPGALTIVEFQDDPATAMADRSRAVRNIVGVFEIPAGLSHEQAVDVVAKEIAPLGPGVRIVYSVEGSRELRKTLIRAYKQERLARPPVAVSIVAGTSVEEDHDLGAYKIGESELIGSLREMVLNGAFSIEPDAGAAALVEAAAKIAVAVAPAGTLRFPARKSEALVFSAALALYPQWHPAKTGRRFQFVHPITGEFIVRESYKAAIGEYGTLVESLVLR